MGIILFISLLAIPMTARHYIPVPELAVLTVKLVKVIAPVC